MGEIYPEMDILKKAIEMNIPIILSSDAHNPSEVGFNYIETLAHLKDLGLKELCKFSKRKKEYVKI